MARADRIKEIILNSKSLEDVATLFQELKFSISQETQSLIVEIDENSYIEVFVYTDNSELIKRAGQHVYQRVGILGISKNFEEWTFLRKGFEDKIRIQKYKFKRTDIRENRNPIAIQRLCDLKPGNISGFEDLFERKDISNKFYKEFKKQKIELINSISGISDQWDRKLYAQILLDRLIFLFFLQSRNLLNENPRYFAEKYRDYCKRKNEFYETFLKELFFNALCRKEREKHTLTIVGNTIPYLNGGLFLKHEIEEKYLKIQVSNESFAAIFQFFESWNWNVNERSDSDEDSIDPYILGYIFENTLGDNKSGGVYYTPSSLSEFLTDETIEEHIFKKANGISASGFYKNTEEFINNSTESELIIFFETILSPIKICDPACGSGQFLVQSLHSLSYYHKLLSNRILKSNLQEIRARIEKPKGYSLERNPIYGIRRFVASNNLYGVDILPEAAEITKLRLFLAMVEGIEISSDQLEPLPNIDFHIRSGDSLTGFLFLPEDFFDGLPSQSSKAKNRKESPSIGVLDFGDAPSKMARKEKLIFLYTNENDPDKALQLRSEIREIDLELQQVLNQRLEHLLSEWKVKPKKKIDFIDEKKDLKAIELINQFVLRTEDLKPFHYGMEFSTVIHPSYPKEAGFDIILMNPPWEVWKPNSQEFFESYIPQFRDLDKNEARLAVATLFKKNAKIKDEWLQHCLNLTATGDLFRNSDFFPNRGSGDINLYKLFLERAWHLLKEEGSLGIVIPSGLYSDLGCKDLRKMLFTEGKINFLYGFENSKALFENVHRSFKFILLSATKETNGPGKSVPSAFMLHSEQDLRSVHQTKKDMQTIKVEKSNISSLDKRFLDLPINLIQKLSPDSLSLMEFKSDTDISIVKKMAKFPRLGEELEGKWNVKLSSEFHMTNHAHLFMTKEQLLKLGAKYDSEMMIWKKGKEEWWPLYEGRMISQYDHRAAGYISGSQRSAIWDYCDFPKNREVRPHYWIIPQWKNGKGYKIYICVVTASSNKRTGLATLVNRKESSGNSLAVIDTENAEANLYLTAIINSFTLDYYVRLRIPGNNYNQAVIFDLPTPRFSTRGLETSTKYESKLIELTASLVGTTNAFNQLLQEIFGPKANFATHGVTDPRKRQKIKNQIDAIVAKIYDLTEEEFQHILSTFPLVENEIKEGVMEEWRKLN
ncbi:restriction endonuclease subunit M [Leptospira langatensis]|uniref:site-specific DNA-methyltransferase (adenine-specific) n=1 Tax=Leptospira langatensis TaxID=2484983 RepID=A0A5F1ZSM7_9LEPT|nr:DNA methyltransferase [Leptospira langatensis]TGK00322.1 restriction endonuclease subunit M [Leptospira langatensis]TGL41041.1 restriction endonuclease subunit M [Leptospira langatensis]